tara:strand:- start:708 stop:833 length:126 start_codon:yes stop_codon:yes gene_type:complete
MTTSSGAGNSISAIYGTNIPKKRAITFTIPKDPAEIIVGVK